MKKLTTIALVFAVLWQPVKVQSQNVANKTEHTVGLQLNELVRQVFNFSNNSGNTAVNPYLLIYNINNHKGWGLRLGVGFAQKNFAENDGITKKNSNLSNLNLRIGAEKSFVLSSKWKAGIGLDVVLGNDKNNTVSEIKSYDTTKTTTESSLINYGGGAMGWLRYRLNKHIQIGTEASFYYVTGKQEDNVTIQRVGQVPPGIVAVSTYTSSSQNFSEAKLRVPVAIYLLVNF